MKGSQIILTKRYYSPCGELLLGSVDGRLCLCDWVHGKHHDHALGRLEKAFNARIQDGRSEVIDLAEIQLDQYFARQRSVFDVPLLFVGTDFQKTVWSELLKIPFGSTVSYRDVALSCGMSKATRAVANAVGANPISIFVPCHRVIGSDRSLTGYDGGLNAKRILLNLES